jgi:hypothetical protein
MPLASRTPAARAVRVPAGVGDLPAALGQPAYVDAFELRLDRPDSRSAEEWARAGLEGAPSVLRWIIRGAQRFVLGLRLAPAGSPDHILGWTIDASEYEVVRLGAASQFMRASIVGRRTDETTVRLTTLLFYDRPWIAQTLWMVVGPVHRRVARLLLQRAARLSHE